MDNYSEQDEQAQANARIIELRQRRDYCVTKQSGGKRENFWAAWVLFYGDYLDDLEQIPFVNVWLPKKAAIIQFEADSVKLGSAA